MARRKEEQREGREVEEEGGKEVEEEGGKGVVEARESHTKEPERRPRPVGSKAMMNRAFSMIWLTIRSILFDRKTLVVAFILMILLVIPILWLRDPPSEEEGSATMLFVIIMVLIYLQFTVLYVCLLFGSSLITSEIEDRTFTYILSRPISKLEVIIYKYIGYVISVFLLFAIPAILNFLLLAPVDEGSAGFSENADLLGFCLAGIFMGILAWGAFFMFMASVFKNPLMPGFLFCLFWESLIANMGTNISKATVTYQIRTFIINGLSESRQAFGDVPHDTYPAWQAFALAVGIAITFLLFAWLALRNKDIH